MQHRYPIEKETKDCTDGDTMKRRKITACGEGKSTCLIWPKYEIYRSENGHPAVSKRKERGMA